MSALKCTKIYHILHYDKLPLVLKDGFLYSDKIITTNGSNGTTIGMSKIKRRRLEECELKSYPGLFVGECVPFYFCPRSVMLYLIHKRNYELEYTGGQSPIIHLVTDLESAINWANQNNKKWAFTTSNAGSYYFEDYCDLSKLNEINWEAVNSKYWSNCREEKQAEFLIEDCFPWSLVEEIGVISAQYDRLVCKELGKVKHNPKIKVRSDWYYY